MPPTRQPSDKLPLHPNVFLILLALADQDAHGYRLRQAVIEKSRGAVVLDPGSLYRLLARMFSDGLVAECGTRSGAEEDERRRCYTLTKLGRTVLAAETERMAQLVASVRALARRPRHA